MKCVLNGTNARVFAKAVQALSKFGPDLYIEADSEGMVLQTVNGNKSAVATFRFRWQFFDSYQFSITPPDDNYCRLSMKAFLGVFRKMRMVDSCQIEIDVVQSKVQIEMNCHHQTKKHSVISIIDDQNIAADVPINEATNVICGSYHVFMDILRHFQAGEDEITLKPQATNFKVQNYIEGNWVNPKFVRARLSFLPKEFKVYNVDEETWITFCLREFRTFVAFAEALHENITIKYSEPGSPVIFHISQTAYEANLIMSTLAPEDISLSESNIHKPLSPKPPKVYEEFNEFEEPYVNGGIERDPETTDQLATPDVPRKQPPRKSIKPTPRFKRTPKKRKEKTPKKSPRKAGVVKVNQTQNNTTYVNSERARKLRSVFVRCFEATYVPQEPLSDSDLYALDSDIEA